MVITLLRPDFDMNNYLFLEMFVLIWMSDFVYSTKNCHLYQVELLQSNIDLLQMCSRVDLLMTSLVSPVTIGKKLLM